MALTRRSETAMTTPAKYDERGSREAASRATNPRGRPEPQCV